MKKWSKKDKGRQLEETKVETPGSKDVAENEVTADEQPVENVADENAEVKEEAVNEVNEEATENEANSNEEPKKAEVAILKPVETEGVLNRENLPDVNEINGKYNVTVDSDDDFENFVPSYDGEPVPDVRYVVEASVNEEDYYVTPKLAKLPNLLDFMLKLKVPKRLKLSIGLMLVKSFEKYKANPVEKQFVVKSMLILMTSIMRDLKQPAA